MARSQSPKSTNSSPLNKTKYGRAKRSGSISEFKKISLIPENETTVQVKITAYSTGAEKQKKESTTLMARRASIRSTLSQTKDLMKSTEENSPLHRSRLNLVNSARNFSTKNTNVLSPERISLTASTSEKHRLKKKKNNDPFHLEKKNRLLQREIAEYRTRNQQLQEDLEKSKDRIEELQNKLETLVVELDQRPTISEVTEYTSQVTSELVDLKKENIKLMKERDDAIDSVQQFTREKKLMEEEILFIQEELVLTADEVELQKHCAKEKEACLLKQLEEKNLEILKLQQQLQSVSGTPNEDLPNSNNEELSHLQSSNEYLLASVKTYESELQKVSQEKFYFEEKCSVLATQLKRLCNVLEESDVLHEKLIATNEENEFLKQKVVELEAQNASLREDVEMLEEDNDELVNKLTEMGLNIAIKEDKLIFSQESLDGLSIDELLNG